jgi:hypothetical protein
MENSMSASFIRPAGTTTPSNTAVGSKVVQVAPFLISPVLLLAALLGAGWLYVPANPAIKTPATTLAFDDLHNLARSGAVPTTWVQENYFGWFGWTLVVIVIALLLATVAAGRRPFGTALAAAGLLGLIFNVFAVKGALSWGQFADQIPNIRIGGYCAIIAYLLAVALGGIRTARR